MCSSLDDTCKFALRSMQSTLLLLVCVYHIGILIMCYSKRIMYHNNYGDHQDSFIAT